MNQMPPRRRRALIVEDEILIALDLEDAMSDLGFEVCPLAASDRNARSLAMRDQPDIALVDVCLEGGREGIETARWLREVCGASVVFVTDCNDEPTVDRIHERVPGAPVLAKPVYRDELASAVASAGMLASLEDSAERAQSSLRVSRPLARARESNLQQTLLRTSNPTFLFAAGIARGEPST